MDGSVERWKETGVLVRGACALRGDWLGWGCRTPLPPFGEEVQKTDTEQKQNEGNLIDGGAGGVGEELSV